MLSKAAPNRNGHRGLESGKLHGDRRAGPDPHPKCHDVACDVAIRCSETIFWIAGGWSFPALSRWRAGCAIVLQQRTRGLLPDRPVWAFLVVVLAPILQLFLRICKA